MFHPRSVRILGCALLLFAGLAGGCSKEKLDELVEKSKQQIDQGVQKAQESINDNVAKAQEGATQAAGTAQEKLQLAGSITLGADGTFKTNGCYARFVAPTAGRPAVLRIQSYRDAASEDYPSVFLRATVTATQPSELVGQTIPAQMFAQAQSGGPVWFADATAPVQLKVVSVDGGKIVAEVAGGALLHSEGGQAVAAAGKLEGVLQSRKEQ